METVPFAIPNAKYWPSLVHAQQFIRDEILNFCTAFCSADQNAKSDCVHDTSWCDTGLKAKHWIESLWLKREKKTNHIANVMGIILCIYNLRVFEYAIKFVGPNNDTFIGTAGREFFSIVRICYCINRIFVSSQRFDKSAFIWFIH